MRPISLCNVTTKSLATRLRKMMEGLVDPNQCSFVPHRQTTDNIIIAQEVIHSMRHKKGKKGWMAIKIDLEKEYDRLSWKFIKETFDDIGFPQRFTELVQYCYSTTSMQVLWNGEALESFKPSRGIRQGDPLSPYIFELFHLINVVVKQKLWRPIKLSKKGPELSCLAFADDLILFAEASMDQVEILKSCVDMFCESSGMKVSQEKTRVYFSKNIGHTVKNEISSSLGYKRTDNLGKYLGVQLHHSRVSRRTLESVMEKVNSRLDQWKTKHLSFAGRNNM
uniref:Retrovirus-related Pol polyprotein LINE-1 n=1 Tax=Cajanus cajan TaxID=3821 RepID=A0A151SDQ0_CAJCA|nr:Retrovirus-related Pol polyprotein LINE-1 [Cajanus cajan]